MLLDILDLLYDDVISHSFNSSVEVRITNSTQEREDIHTVTL